MSESSDSTNAAEVNPHAESVRTLASAMLRTALLPGLATVLIAVALATLLAGLPGLYGALIGGAVAFGSSLATIGMMRWSADLPVMMVMSVALGGYVFKLVALLAVMVSLKNAAWLDKMSLALTVLATILVWAAAELVAFKRTKIPTLIID